MALALAKRTNAGPVSPQKNGAAIAPLLTHLAKGPEIEGPDHILQTIEASQDPATLCWAAAAISGHLHQAPENLPASAVETFSRCLLFVAGPKNAALSSGTAQLGHFGGNWRLHPPHHCPAARSSGLQVLDGSEREAASAVLGVLLELVRTRPDDLEYLRAQMFNEGDESTCWFIALFSVMAEHAPPKDKNAPRSLVAQASHDSGGAAFVNACHFLAVMTNGHPELTKKLLSAHVLDHVGSRLLRATVATTTGTLTTLTSGGGSFSDCDLMGTEWLPFATSAALLVDALVGEEDDERWRLAEPAFFRPMWVRGQRPDVVVDGLLAALERSLLHDGGSMVPQPLHISGLRALGRIAHLSNGQAHRMIVANGLKLGVKALTIDGVDEEAVLVILWYLAEVSSASPYAHKQLAALGTSQAVQKTVARYPRSQAVKSEAARVLQACAGPQA